MLFSFLDRCRTARSRTKWSRSTRLSQIRHQSDRRRLLVEPLENRRVLATLSIAVDQATELEGNAGTTPFTFTVTRTSAAATSTVDFTVAGSGTAQADATDFGGALPSGTLSFAIGELTQTLTIDVAGDAVVEANEGFTVTLSNQSAGDTLGTDIANGVILNDDTVGSVTLDIAADFSEDFEGDVSTTPLTFIVTRSGDTTGGATVEYAVTGSGSFPAAASDFAGGVLPSGTIEFAPGEMEKTITVDVRGDLTVEGDEGFTVTLSDATGATIGVDSDFGLILNDDTQEIGVDTSNQPGAKSGARITADLDNPGEDALVVTGTSGNDVIIIEPRPGSSTQIRVKMNGRVIGNFNRTAVDNIVVFGRGGNDVIVVNASLSIDALLFGEAGIDKLFGARGDDGLDGGSGRDFLYGLWGDDELEGGTGDDFLFGGTGHDQLLGSEGNDYLYGESGHDILLGGTGVDRLFGGSGRDLLIGGDGGDYLFGGSDDDVLIGGTTALDTNEAALLLILAELRSSSSYKLRVDNLRSAFGFNVFDDGDVDRMWGNAGLDYFVKGPGDRVYDKTNGELVN